MQTFLIGATFVSTFLICLAVWRMLVSSSRNTNLEEKTKKRFKTISAVYLFGWYFLMTGLAGAEVFSASKLPIFPSITILFGVCFPIIIGLVLVKVSPTLKIIVRSVPAHYLISIQFYRVLGILFIGFYLLNRLPPEFALPAGIGDILVGAAAPIVGYFLMKNYRKSRKWAIAWNLFGIFDLIVALSCGFLSSPSPFQMLAMETPNQLITVIPLVMVPVFALPLSILLHIISLSQLKLSAQAAGIQDEKSFAVALVK